MLTDDQRRMRNAMAAYVPHTIIYDEYFEINHDSYVDYGLVVRIEAVRAWRYDTIPLIKTKTPDPDHVITLTFGSAHGSVYGYRYDTEVTVISERSALTRRYNTELNRFNTTIMYELFVPKTGRIEAVTIDQIDCSPEARQRLESGL